MKRSVLFLCTGNSCRSVLAEATFNALAGPEWRAMSAGSHPTGTVHPRSLALLRREGISTEGLHSKSWVGLPSIPDIVLNIVEVKGSLARIGHLLPSRTVDIHWAYSVRFFLCTIVPTMRGFQPNYSLNKIGI